MASRGHHLTFQLQLTSTWTAHGCWIFLPQVCKTNHLIPWVLACSSNHPPSYCQSDCSKSQDVTFMLKIISWLPGYQGRSDLLLNMPASLPQIFYNPLLPVPPLLPTQTSLPSGHTQSSSFTLSCCFMNFLLLYLEFPPLFSQLRLVLQNLGPELPFPEKPFQTLSDLDSLLWALCD